MKVIGWIIGIVALIIVGMLVLVAVNSGDLIKRGIEALGPRYLGADVSVAAVDISLTEGSGEIRGLEIGNPRGFSGPPAFDLEQMRLVLDTSELTPERVVIKELVVDGASVDAIAKGAATNLQRLLDNVKAATGGGGDSASGEESAFKVIIDRFAFTNARVSLDSDLVGSRELRIPDVHLSDIGRKEGGVTAGEALQQILEPLYEVISERIVAEGIDLDQVRDDLEQNLREKAEEKLGGGLKSLTDRLQQESQ